MEVVIKELIINTEKSMQNKNHQDWVNFLNSELQFIVPFFKEEKDPDE